MVEGEEVPKFRLNAVTDRNDTVMVFVDNVFDKMGIPKLGIFKNQSNLTIQINFLNSDIANEMIGKLYDLYYSSDKGDNWNLYAPGIQFTWLRDSDGSIATYVIGHVPDDMGDDSAQFLFKVKMVDAPFFELISSQLVYAEKVYDSWYQPTQGQTITKGTDTLDITWLYSSTEVAASMDGKLGTLLWSPDSGETWHVYSDAIDMTANYSDGTNYIGTNLELTGDQINFGGSNSDTFYLKIVMNDYPYLELSSSGMLYVIP